ncbi:MAG: iron-sulfur cluster assembly protein [bacterium]
MSDDFSPGEGPPAGLKYDGDRTFREAIVNALKTIYDPEIPVDIYELGLVYGVTVGADRNVRVEMTLTSPACPSAEAIPVEVQEKLQAIQGLGEVKVDIVWDPTWSPAQMSEAAKVTLGWW